MINKMFSLPKISIIIPSFNQVKYIEETFLSIINQNYDNLEIIVIDGGSTDGSVNIIKKYEEHLHYWVSEKDHGQSNAINKGFSRASGEIVTWLCSDDTYLPNCLRIVGEFFNKNPKVDFLYGNVISINEHSITTNKIRNLPFSKIGFLNSVGSIPQPASFYKNSVLTKINLLNEDMNFFMDYDFFARMILSGSRFKSISNVLATYRYHYESKTINSRSNFRAT